MLPPHSSEFLQCLEVSGLCPCRVDFNFGKSQKLWSQCCRRGPVHCFAIKWLTESTQWAGALSLGNNQLSDQTSRKPFPMHSCT